MYERETATPKSTANATRVIAGGMAARLVGLPMSAIATAVTAYLTIRYVGEELYGYISLVATLFLLLPFADFGLGVVIINAIARIPPGQVPTARELDTIRRVFIRLVALATLLVAGAFITSSAGGWSKTLNIPASLTGADIFTASALSIYFLAIPFSIGQRILVGLGRNSEMTLISVIAPLVTAIGTGLLIAAKCPPMSLALAPSFGIMLNNLIMCWRGFKHLGIRMRDIRDISPNVSPEPLAHSAVSFFIFSLGLPIAMQSGRLILSNFSTAAELSTYSLMAQMYVPTLSVITIGSLALWPAYKRGGTDAGNLWVSSLKTLGVVGLLIGTIFGLLAPLAAYVISSGEIRPNAYLCAAFAALIFLMSIQQASGQLLTDESGLRFQAVCVVALAAISISLSVLWARPLGAVGPVLASIVAITVAQVIPGVIRARKVTRAHGLSGAS